jgi:nucleoid-associated protein YgaU
VPPVAPTIASIANSGKVITVQPGDSLWKIAEQHLGNGLLWRELISVNPGISDPSRILAGSQIVLPASDSSQRSTKYTVQKGDTLWTIAQSHLGHATAWSCVAKANPEVVDSNLILEGQVLTLPASCKP